MMTDLNPTFIYISSSLAFAQTVILVGIRSILVQVRRMNGSISNTRETYVPKVDCKDIVSKMDENLKRSSEEFKKEMRTTEKEFEANENSLRKESSKSLARIHGRIDEVLKMLVERK